MNLRRIDEYLRRLGANRTILVSLGISVLVWLVYFFGFRGSGTGLGTTETGNIASRTEGEVRSHTIGTSDNRGGSRVSAQSDDAAIAVRGFERLVLGRRQAAVKRVLEDAEESLRRLQAHVVEWQQFAPPLQENDLGKALASDQERLPGVIAAMRAGAQGSTAAEEYQNQLREIMAEFSSIPQGAPDISESVLTEVESLRSEIQSREREVQGALTFLRDEVRLAEGRPRGQFTLRQAMTRFEEGEAKYSFEAQVEAQKRAREESRQLLLEAERSKLEEETRLAQAKLEVERERLRAEAEEQRLLAEKEKEENQVRLAKAELEAEFTRDLKEINSLLALFVTRTNSFLTPPYILRPSVYPAGLSLSAVQQTGALEDTDDGLEALARLSMEAESVRRPLGTFPPYSPSQWKRNAGVKRRLQRAQELLIKYGDLLVEKGMMEK